MNFSAGAPVNSIEAIWPRLSPVIVILLPAFIVSGAREETVGRFITRASEVSISLGLAAKSVSLKVPVFASFGIATVIV